MVEKRLGGKDGALTRHRSRTLHVNVFHLVDDMSFECESLCRIEIPSSVETIAIVGFSGCTGLRAVIIRAGSRMRVNRGLRNIKPFLIYEDNGKEGRSRTYLGFLWQVISAFNYPI
jgi:hypothetical protein